MDCICYLFVSLTDTLAEISPMLIVHAEFMLGKSPWKKKKMKCTAGLLCKMFIFIQSNTPQAEQKIGQCF